MKLVSKIKKLFPDELIRLLAVTCSTMRINSSHHKMLIIQQLLKKYGIRFSVLGGATNRLTLFIDGYAVKFAVDNQGYVDNLVEYSIGKELQPYVAKPYETNGYILVAECVKTLTLDDFKLRRSDIESILSILSQDYLLGDVGYITTNYTNWGMRDDGSIVIVDYAYIHRGTEKLFTCEVCGCGILRYDPTYSYLKCSNSASCNAQFTYIERKMIQGDQVDLDMIEEAKAESIKIPKNAVEKIVTDNDGKLVAGNKIVTKSYSEYLNYLTEVQNKMNGYDNEKALDLMIKRANAKSADEANKIADEIHKLYEETVEDEVDEETPEVVYEPSYGDTIPYPEEVDDESEEEEVDEEYDADAVYDAESAFDKMMRSVKGAIAPTPKKEVVKEVVPVVEEEPVVDEVEPEEEPVDEEEQDEEDFSGNEPVYVDTVVSDPEDSGVTYNGEEL